MPQFPNMSLTERISLFPYLDYFLEKHFTPIVKQKGGYLSVDDTGTKEAPKWVLEIPTENGRDLHVLNLIWHLLSPAVEKPYMEVQAVLPNNETYTANVDLSNPSESLDKILEEYEARLNPKP